MEIQAAQPLSGYPSATYPRWVVLEFHCARKNKQHPNFVDATTLAAARTSTGHPIQPPRPPSLSLLPPYLLAEEERDKFLRPVHRCLELFATGLLRCGDDEIVVAELTTVVASHDEQKKVAELFMLRSGVWSMNYPPISHCDDRRGRQDLPSVWKSDIVVPERPRLQYVPLPKDESFVQLKNRNVCVTAGGDTLKFVNMFPHCCCGGEGASNCDCSHNAYTIKTWALSTDDMVWVMDSMVSSTELRAALDSYEDLPRVPLSYPVVNMDKPHVISFQLCESSYHVKCGDPTLWLVTVDMMRKTVQLVSQCPGGEHLFGRPSRVSYYFNSCQSKSSDDTSNGRSQANIEQPPVVTDDEQLTLLQSSSNSSVGPALQASEILVALEEIPSYSLARADQLKTYTMTMAAVPNASTAPNEVERKDWLLMDIKDSEA
ncbi:hypothetical protein EJB05_29113, partial [Eragrostis curvula]